VTPENDQDITDCLNQRNQKPPKGRWEADGRLKEIEYRKRRKRETEKMNHNLEISYQKT
jgi:hypothetical protein